MGRGRFERPVMKFLPALLLAPLALSAADPLPDPAKVIEALKKAVSFCTEKLAVHGGYASSWKKDLSAGMTEHSESKTVISIQPPGTTTLGLAFVKAFQATGDTQFLEAARAAGRALVECQLASGGWSSDFDFAPEKAKKYWLHQQVLAGDKEQGKRNNMSTLDDNKTQSALLFLVELAHLPECRGDAVLQEAVKFAFDSLLAAQYPNGAWPQQFSGPADPATPVKKAAYPASWPREFPKVNYTSFYTLNDVNLQRAAHLMLRAHELSGDERFLNSARKVGDFLILAQMPEPQPGWAQQYNHDMEPVWARKFEPPAIAGRESVDAMLTLIRIARLTREARYVATIPQARAWLQRSLLPDGTLSRYYELQTNKPLYMTDDYQLTHDAERLARHYGWHDESPLPRIDAQMSALRSPPQPDTAPRVTDDEVRALITSLDADGRWMSTYDGQMIVGQPKFKPGQAYLSSAVFAENLVRLGDYLRQAKAAP